MQAFKNLFRYDSDIYTTLNFLSQITRIFGIFPHRKEYDSTQNITKYTKLRMDARTSTFVTLYIISQACGIYVFLSLEYLHKNKFRNIFIMVSTIITGVIAFVNIYAREAAFLNAIELHRSIDDTFKTIHRKFTFRYINIIVIAMGCFFMIAILTYVLLTAFTNADKWLQIFLALLYVLCLLPKIMQVYLFVFLSLITAHRFYALNVFLEQTAKEGCKDKQEASFRLYVASNVHFMLCEYCQAVNEFAAVDILCNVLCALSNILWAFDVRNETADQQMLVFVMPAVYEVTTFFLVVLACELVITESRKAGRILCDLDISYYDCDIWDQKATMLLQLLHTDVVFTAAKLFEIDADLLFKVFGTVTTLILLIQQMDG